jgi:hypothetical protein
VVLGLLGVTLVLVCLAKAQPTLADPAEWAVCPAGPPSCDFATIQDGVDAAGDGDGARHDRRRGSQSEWQRQRIL